MIPLVLSRYALLRLAGLVVCSANRRRLDAALDRLCRPVGDAEHPASPLPTDWQTTAAGLDLQVSGEWLEPPFAALPLPLPMLRSPNALSLYLFLQGIDTRGIKAAVIQFVKLCQRLGIPFRHGAAYCGRKLDAALDVVNSHLATLPFEALAKHKVRPPAECRIEVEDKGRALRFVGLPYRFREVEYEVSSEHAPVFETPVLPPRRPRQKLKSWAVTYRPEQMTPTQQFKALSECIRRHDVDGIAQLRGMAREEVEELLGKCAQPLHYSEAERRAAVERLVGIDTESENVG